MTLGYNMVLIDHISLVVCHILINAAAIIYFCVTDFSYTLNRNLSIAFLINNMFLFIFMAKLSSHYSLAMMIYCLICLILAIAIHIYERRSPYFSEKYNIYFTHANIWLSVLSLILYYLEFRKNAFLLGS